MYKTAKLELIKALELMPHDLPIGICQYINRINSIHPLTKSYFNMNTWYWFSTWTEFSGESQYPIPIQSDQGGPHPRDAYLNPSPLYHQARNRLRLHILSCLMDELRNSQDTNRPQLPQFRAIRWPNPPRPEIRITATELRQQELRGIHVNRIVFDDPIPIPAPTQGDDSEEHF